MKIPTSNICVLLLVVVLSACRMSNGDKPLIGGIQSREVVVDARQSESRETRRTTSAQSDGNRLEMPAPLADRPEQLLIRKGYAVSYNKETRLPNWVAWHLTADHTTGSFKRAGMKYYADEEVPFPKAEDNDYYNSGYDRGHMCPSGDNKWDGEAQEQCFLFTNICPQSHSLNGGDWNELEMKCRKWAERYGDIYIVCGPIFYDGTHKTIGRHKVVVPEAFFKVVLRLDDTPRAIAFIYKNEDGNRPMGDYVNSLVQVERITGIRFFPHLSATVRRQVANEADLRDWR